jgi:hypothetical protein
MAIFRLLLRNFQLGNEAMITISNVQKGPRYRYKFTIHPTSSAPPGVYPERIKGPFP